MGRYRTIERETKEGLAPLRDDETSVRVWIQSGNRQVAGPPSALIAEIERRAAGSGLRRQLRCALTGITNVFVLVRAAP